MSGSNFEHRKQVLKYLHAKYIHRCQKETEKSNEGKGTTPTSRCVQNLHIWLLNPIK